MLGPFGRTVKGEIMTGATFMIAAMGFFAMGHIHHGLARLLRSELSNRGLAVGDMVAESAGRLLITGDEFALHRLLRDTVERSPDVSYAFLADPSGTPVAHSFSGGFPRQLARAVRPTPARGMTLLDTPEEGRVQDIAVPLPEARLGTVHIGLRERRVRGRIASLVMGWSIAVMLLLAGGLAAAYWLTTKFSARIDRLIQTAEQVGRGDLSARAADAHPDEIGRLAAAFDAMTANLKSSQAELIRAGKLAAIGELASGVAHEINNPLNTMGICARSLRQRAGRLSALAIPDLADFPEYLGAIEEEIRRCKKITSSLLDFSRLRKPVKGPVSLNDLVLETLPLAELRGRTDAVVEHALDPDLPRLEADRDELRQVLVNLLLNALDQSPPGGVVRVETERANGSVLLRVRDHGNGIAPEHAARLFDPFFSTKPPGEGTGLGLAICRRIVEGHGGRIQAANTNQGAVFTISLPAAGGQDV